MKVTDFEIDNIKIKILENSKYFSQTLFYCADDCQYIKFDKVEQNSYCTKFNRYLSWQGAEIKEQYLIENECIDFCADELKNKELKKEQ